MYLRRRHADRDSRSKLVWIATLSYGNELQLQINPLAEPALVGWATETAQVPAIRDSGPDKTGTNPRAILNSAGQVFDNYPGRDDSIWIATIRKNLASLSPEIFVYIDGVNLDTVVIDGRSFSPGQCKVMAIDVPLEWSYRNGVQYKQVAFKIGCRHDWQTHMLDQGLVGLQKVGGGYIPSASPSRTARSARGPSCWTAAATACSRSWGIRPRRPTPTTSTPTCIPGSPSTA